MTAPLVHFFNRLNAPATATDYLFGFVLLASLLSFEATTLSLVSSPDTVELVRHQAIEMPS